MRGTMRWLFKPKKMAILDVGSHTLKLAEFSFKKRKLFLENISFLPVADNAIEQGDLMNVDSLKEALPAFISQNIEGQIPEIYVVMSGRSIIVKKLEILRSEKDLLDDLMREEVRQNLPFDIEEINYDYTPLDTLPTEDKSKMNILLFVAKKKEVAKVNDMIEQAGYKCVSVDMGGLALASALRFIETDIEQKEEDILILDIGKAGTSFIVLHKGQLICSRYITVGSEFYTQSIMREMNMEYPSAEALKFSWCSGTETPAELNKIMAESNRYFCDEISLGYEYFQNQFPNASLSRSYITGGGGKLSNLMSALSKRFNIPFKLLDPFPSLPLSEALGDSQDHVRHWIPLVLGACLNGYVNK